MKLTSKMAKLSMIFAIFCGSDVFSQTMSQVPPAEALSPGALPAGSTLTAILSKEEAYMRLPGSWDGFGSYYQNESDNKIECDFSVEPVLLYQRIIPPRPLFRILSAKEHVTRGGVGEVIFQVSSEDATFVKQIKCKVTNGKTVGDYLNVPDYIAILPMQFAPTMNNLACLFDIRIQVPVGETNPPLVCDTHTKPR